MSVSKKVLNMSLRARKGVAISDRKFDFLSKYGENKNFEIATICLRKSRNDKTVVFRLSGAGYSLSDLRFFIVKLQYRYFVQK